MAGFNLGEFLFGKPPEIITKTMEDPIKTGVSRPLSSFLASNVGKGLPRYGGELSSKLDPEAESRYKEFISLDAPTFFEEKIASPATQRFQEDFLPVLRESFAGGLRGSGRVGSERQAINEFSQDLATQQGRFELELPASQFAMASTRKAQKDADLTRVYTDWYKSLPEMSPVLGQALQFLGMPTGLDILSATDPGTEGAFIDLLKISASALGGGTADTSVTPTGTTTVSGGTFGTKSTGSFDSFF